jgi:hypothetical protein
MEFGTGWMAYFFVLVGFPTLRLRSVQKGKIRLRLEKNQFRYLVVVQGYPIRRKLAIRPDHSFQIDECLERTRSL